MSARRLVPALVAVTLAACQSDAPVAPAAETAHLHPEAMKVEDVRQADLDKLRDAIRPYNRVKLAKEGGWTFIIPNLDGRLCFRSPDGAMGFHYANPALIEDGKVSLKHPEALLFEPPRQVGGRPKLVGVEYIVPIALWNKPNPPRLFGREFSEVAGFGVYGLHVWIERKNPKGLFAPYNPNVSCHRGAK